VKFLIPINLTDDEARLLSLVLIDYIAGLQLSDQEEAIQTRLNARLLEDKIRIALVMKGQEEFIKYELAKVFDTH
jgi:hypothetical protein